MAGEWLKGQHDKYWHPTAIQLKGLPERFVTAHPDSIPIKEIRDVALRYCRNFDVATDKGIAPALFGRVRVYKTYAAAVVARYVYGVKRVNVEFVNAGAEFLRMGLQRFDSGTLLRLDKLVECSFLILDDITNVNPNGIGQELLTDVVCRRFEQQMPTLITGNWNLSGDLEGFASRYNQALARRIWDGGEGYRITVTGKA